MYQGNETVISPKGKTRNTISLDPNSSTRLTAECPAKGYQKVINDELRAMDGSRGAVGKEGWMIEMKCLRLKLLKLRVALLIVHRIRQGFH